MVRRRTVRKRRVGCDGVVFAIGFSGALKCLMSDRRLKMFDTYRSGNWSEERLVGPTLLVPEIGSEE